MREESRHRRTWTHRQAGCGHGGPGGGWPTPPPDEGRREAGDNLPPPQPSPLSVYQSSYRALVVRQGSPESQTDRPMTDRGPRTGAHEHMLSGGHSVQSSPPPIRIRTGMAVPFREGGPFRVGGGAQAVPLRWGPRRAVFCCRRLARSDRRSDARGREGMPTRTPGSAERFGLRRARNVKEPKIQSNPTNPQKDMVEGETFGPPQLGTGKAWRPSGVLPGTVSVFCMGYVPHIPARARGLGQADRLARAEG